VIQQAPRGGDQHVHAAIDQAILLLEADAPDQERLGELGVFGVDVEILGHLGGKLAGGGEHQRAGHARARAALLEAGDDGQGEGGRLAGARLGDAQHVAPFEGGGDGAGLDRRGRFVAGFFNRLEDLGIEIEI